MDLAVDHFANVETNYVNRGEQFYTGVVVFEDLSKAEAAIEVEPGSSSSSKNPVVVPALIEAGKIFVAEKDIQRCHTCQSTEHLQANCPDKQRGKKCRHCNQTGHIKQNCPDLTCARCGQRGHMAGVCTNEAQCNKCEQSGHTTRDCKTRVQDVTQPKVCKQCGETGHVAVHCPQQCFICKQEGHASMDCTSDVLVEQDSATGAAVDTSTASEVPGPTHLYSAPDTGSLDVVLTTQKLPHHGSALQVTFRSSYVDDSFNSGRACNIAYARFIPDNLASTVEVTQVEPNSPEVQRLLRPDTVAHMTKVAAKQGDDTKLYHIQFTARGQDQVRGSGLFSDRKYGPHHTVLMHSIRDLLIKRDTVIVHFFALGSVDLAVDIIALQSAFETQIADPPLMKWWPHGKPVPQKGVELPAAERPEGKVPARDTYDDYDEFITVNYYGAIGELESVGESQFESTRIVLVNFLPASQNIFYILIEQRESFHLRPDDRIKVAFVSDTGDTDLVWTGHVVAPTPIGDGYHFEAIIRRPHHGGSFAPEPHFTEAHYVNARSTGTMAELKDAINAHRGIQVQIQCDPSHNHYDKEIKTLFHLHQNRYALYSDIEAMLNNNWLKLEKVNFFKTDIQKHGQEMVNAAWKEATSFIGLDSTQLKIESLLQNMPAGYALIQGTGGTGKTTLFTAIALYLFVLQVFTKGERGQVWTVSPINSQLDDMASKYSAVLNTWLKRYQEAHPGETIPPPIVVRYHMRETEKAILEQDARQERIRTGQEQDHYALCEEETDLDADLAMALFLREQYVQEFDGIQDKRLRVVDLSEGAWMLRLAGVPDRDGNVHPIAQGVKRDAHASFRSMLDMFKSGQHMNPTQKNSWTTSRNRLSQHLAEIAHVRLSTMHVAAETRMHTQVQPRALLVDEAGKTTERSLINAIAFRQPYNQDNGNRIDLGTTELVPVLLAGDIWQPRPVLGPNADAPFHAHTCRSTFARWIDGGAPTLWLKRQHRYQKEIAEIVNAVLPNEPIETSESVVTRKTRGLVRGFLKTAFGVDSQCVYVSLRSKERTNEFTKSRYNLDHVRRVLFFVGWALEMGIKGQDIAIATPYTAQVVAYKSGLHLLQEKLRGSNRHKRLAEEIDHLIVVTWDGIQGQEKPFVLMDSVITDKFGFMYDFTRWLLGHTRAKDGLIVFGNERDLAAQYTDKKAWIWKSSAFCKTVHAFKQKGWYFALDNPLSEFKLVYDQYTLSFEVDQTLETVYASRLKTEPPFEFNDEVPAPPANMPSFMQEEEESPQSMLNSPYDELEGYEACMTLFAQDEGNGDYDEHEAENYTRVLRPILEPTIRKSTVQLFMATNCQVHPQTCLEFLRLHEGEFDEAFKHLTITRLHASVPGLDFEDYAMECDAAAKDWDATIASLSAKAKDKQVDAESGFGEGNSSNDADNNGWANGNDADDNGWAKGNDAGNNEWSNSDGAGNNQGGSAW